MKQRVFGAEYSVNKKTKRKLKGYIHLTLEHCASLCGAVYTGYIQATRYSAELSYTAFYCNSVRLIRTQPKTIPPLYAYTVHVQIRTHTHAI